MSFEGIGSGSIRSLFPLFGEATTGIEPNGFTVAGFGKAPAGGAGSEASP
jgi:hypothetical protein